MELLPPQQIAFRTMLDTIRRGFERFGFLPIETPLLEYADILLTKSGGETEKQVFFAQSTGSRERGREPELALRFDLTVPLARYVAEHEGQLSFPFRRYQIERVHRGERPQRGRYREFYQCDIDVIGRESLDPRFDAEIPAAIIEVFRDLAVGDFTVHFSNRKVLRGYLEALGVDAPTQALALREIDKIDKRGIEQVERALTAPPFALSSAVVAQLSAFLRLRGRPSDLLAELDGRPVENEGYREGVEELGTVVEALEALGVPPQYYAIDLSIARGLDYYTGTVYETLIDAHPEIGSVCSGGRYDDLASLYTSSQLPGVGMSIGATRLFYQLRQLGLVGDGAAVAHVLVTQQDPELIAEYLSLASELRQAGLNTEVILENWKFKKQMKYANSSRIPYVLIIGKAEHDQDAVTLRDMTSGEQVQVPRTEIAGHLRGIHFPAGV